MMSSAVEKSTQRCLRPDTSGDEICSSARQLMSQVRQRIVDAEALTGSDQDEAIHQTRVDMKRLRALWYLASPGINRAESKMLHAASREVAKVLEGAREAVVMLETLQGLDIELPEAVRRDIETELRQTFQPAADPGEPLVRVRLRLDELQQRVLETQWQRVCRAHLRQGLQRTADRNQRLYLRALDAADMDALHHWRKWVKVWMYQVYWLLGSEQPGWCTRLKPLGSALGKVHDLDMLTGVLRPLWGRFSSECCEQLQDSLGRQRYDLLGQIHANAVPIFARSPEERTRKLFCRWLKQPLRY